MSGHLAVLSGDLNYQGKKFRILVAGQGVAAIQEWREEVVGGWTTILPHFPKHTYKTPWSAYLAAVMAIEKYLDGGK